MGRGNRGEVQPGAARCCPGDSCQSGSASASSDDEDADEGDAFGIHAADDDLDPGHACVYLTMTDRAFLDWIVHSDQLNATAHLSDSDGDEELHVFRTGVHHHAGSPLGQCDTHLSRERIEQILNQNPTQPSGRDSGPVLSLQSLHDSALHASARASSQTPKKPRARRQAKPI